MKALLEVSNLTASYGRIRALHGIGFTLHEGTVTALLGANGAGKTTTLRALSGMVSANGYIEFDGRPLIGKSTSTFVKAGIAHVPQGRGTFTKLTVEENLRLGAITRHDHREIASDIARMFDLFPILRARRWQQAGLLSGGEQQMLAVARALMLRPRLVLLDEPSFGLAPLIVREVFDTLARVNREAGTTILVVEQNADIALGISHYAYVMETGRIVMARPAADVMKDDAIRRSYLGY